MTKSTAYLWSQSPITFWENLLKLCKGVRKMKTSWGCVNVGAKFSSRKKISKKKKKYPKEKQKLGYWICEISQQCKDWKFRKWWKHI